MEKTLAWTIRGLKLSDFLFMLKATNYTLELASVAIGGGLLLAVIIGILRTTQKAKFLNYISRIYVEFFRGTPVLIQIFMFYYGLMLLNIKFPALLSELLRF